MIVPDIRAVFVQAGGLLAIFTLVHFMADWFPQSHREAYLKYTDKLIRIRHCVVYAMHFIPIFIWLGMIGIDGALSLAVLIVSHYFIDTYWPIYLWAKFIRRPPEMMSSIISTNESFKWKAFLDYIDTPSGRINMIMVDQIMHIVVLTIPISFALITK